MHAVSASNILQVQGSWTYHSQHQAVRAQYVTYVLQVPEHVVAHSMDAALLLRLFASQQHLAPVGQLSHGCGVLLICEALSIGLNAIAAQLLTHLLLQLLLERNEKNS